MRHLAWVALFPLLLAAPNLIWLATSSIRIDNLSATEVTPQYEACDRRHQVGEIASGDFVFAYLEACGDDTLTIHIDKLSYCQIYVEGELYHIDVSINAADQVDCVYANPFSSLFLARLIW